ncbi:MAG: type I DNA topoisomerase, partial [Candidatus Pacebacteria bacterium]|nr:type I DNA topoisomerase [Candidatus Paceibacterota bacterium]
MMAVLKNAKGKILVIVESPAKAKTIEKYLGDQYMVRASVGHVRDLPKSNKKAIDIDAGFVPNYEISTGKHKVIAELESLANEAKEVILATDPDREGEAIAWHLSEILEIKNPKRVVYQEITKDAVQEAFNHPRTIDQNMRKAQEARRVLDRLVGYDLSGLIWQKVRYGLSAGRVQSPALRIIMEREREIRAFVPKDFWVITTEASTSQQRGRTSLFEMTCVEEPSTQDEADRIVKISTESDWTVTSVTESEAKRAPRAPFTTSTLQQTASTRLGYSPSNTMRIAQKLYEKGHITYMRTDSPALSKQAQGQALALIESEYGKEFVQPRNFKSRSKSAQEAHEAVRPSNLGKHTAGNTADEQKLYKLIWARTVASQMADARVKRMKILANVTDSTEEIPDFAVRGSRVIFDGWLKADPAAKGEDTQVPAVVQSDALDISNVKAEGKQTQPKGRYTEAGLIKELEKRGIGRPSTYASIIKTLNDRGYVEKQGKTLLPTDTGDVVSSFLEEHFSKYISDTFTAEMEDELDEVAEGKREYIKTLTDFYTPFTKVVESKADIPKVTNMGDAPSEFKCPECNSKMVYKLSKSGKFISCSKFPDCNGARKDDGNIIEPPKEIGEECPKCGVATNRRLKVHGTLV